MGSCVVTQLWTAKDPRSDPPSGWKCQTNQDLRTSSILPTDPDMSDSGWFGGCSMFGSPGTQETCKLQNGDFTTNASPGTLLQLANPIMKPRNPKPFSHIALTFASQPYSCNNPCQNIRCAIGARLTPAIAVCPGGRGGGTYLSGGIHCCIWPQDLTSVAWYS